MYKKISYSVFLMAMLCCNAAELHETPEPFGTSVDCKAWGRQLDVLANKIQKEYDSKKRKILEAQKRNLQNNYNAHCKK